jgi:O-antigen/teichoic acid export membrane protein
MRVFGTFANRLLTAVLNFLIVLLTARLAGTEGRGEISMLVLNATIIQLFTGIAGGAALTYLAPRYRFSQLWLVSTLWCILSSYGTMHVIQLIHAGSASQGNLLLMFALPAALFINQQSLLLAYQRIQAYNLISILQPLILFTLIWYTHEGWLGISATAMYASYGFYSYISVYLLSFLFLQKLPVLPSAGITEIGSRLIVHGGWSQLANLAQLMNYRFSYYFLEAMKGNAVLGLFSTGVSIAESVWVFSKSLATLHYAKTVNQEEREHAAILTVNLVKLSVVVSSFAILIMALLPDSLYSYLLGDSFDGIRHIIVLIGLSIVALSGYTLLAAYFSGTGRHNISSYASISGLVITLISCTLFIPVYGIIGACWAMNLSHAANGAYLLYRFHQDTQQKISVWKFRRRDFKLIQETLKKI